MTAIAQQVLTAGEFVTEEQAVEFFDIAVRRSGAFRSYSEVEGFTLQPRFGCSQVRMRIDRVLVPNQKIIDAGWLHGPIGIECKKSGMKTGKVIAQAMDYSRCVFELPPIGFLIYLRWIFVWPMERPTHDIASVMAQHRVGYVQPTKNDGLTFYCGDTGAIRIGYDGTVTARTVEMGNKAGSR